MTKTAENLWLWGRTYLYSQPMSREYPPGTNPNFGTVLQLISFCAHYLPCDDVLHGHMYFIWIFIPLYIIKINSNEFRKLFSGIFYRENVTNYNVIVFQDV